MSHLEEGFTVTSLQALAQTVRDYCPDLEMVKGREYRTWVTEHGGLAGDYPLPGVYQARLLQRLKQAGVDLADVGAKCAVTLPSDLRTLEDKPWTLEEQNRLLQDPRVKQGYAELQKQILSRDAEYVIRYKQHLPQAKSAYEIGVVKHPWRTGEYSLMTDFYQQGRGLLTAQGVGTYSEKDGKSRWGSQLKHNYAVCAAEQAIQTQIQRGNPEYGSYRKVALSDGRVKLEVFPR